MEINNMKKIKYLVLSHKYYSMIESGEKCVELRSKDFDCTHIKFQKGYQKSAPQMIFKVKHKWDLNTMPEAHRTFVVRNLAKYNGDLGIQANYAYVLDSSSKEIIRESSVLQDKAKVHNQ